MDLLVELYHRVAFPLCKIKLVKRFNYIKIDRHKLSYLNCLEKIGCAYCGYANGLVNYWVKIAAESEKFWCAIKHEKCKDFMVPEHHKEFVDYGDDKGFKKLK